MKLSSALGRSFVLSLLASALSCASSGGGEPAATGGTAGSIAGASSGSAGVDGGAAGASTGSAGSADAIAGFGGESAGSSGSAAGSVGMSGAAGAPGTVISATLNTTLRFKQVNWVGASGQCVTVSGAKLALATCGAAGQAFRVSMLGPEYFALLDDASGQCVTASGTTLALSACTNVAAQQFSFTGAAALGYAFKALGANGNVTAALGVGAEAGIFRLPLNGDADPMAVIVDERPVGWATQAADIIVPDGAKPNGDEKTRRAEPTTGGGSWEAARAGGFKNVTWVRPADFSGNGRETAIANFEKALKAVGPHIVLMEAGTYDFALSTPAKVNKCNGTCSTGGSYPETGGFCPNDAACSSTAGCVVQGYNDASRQLDVGSDLTLIGLGSGAVFKKLELRMLGQRNLIYRNTIHTALPGDARAWTDGMLFWPADHVWVDHVSFSGFGRGAVVLSGTRVADGGSFYAYHDSGWMTFSWLAIDSREPWRCAAKEDSPYPFFTTNDPALTFHHALFLAGHGRNPAIDGEGAHFYNTAWSQVSDGLDGRGSAKLLVEGSYFDGARPIRMDDPLPPLVRAPYDARAPSLGNPRKLNTFSAAAMSSLTADWKGRKLDVNTLNTNVVAAPPYPYSLDEDPSKTLATVNAGAGVGKGGFPTCTLSGADLTQYVCK